MCFFPSSFHISVLALTGRHSNLGPSGPELLSLSLFALPGVPLVQPGDDLAGIILDALARSGEALMDGDVLVLAQKIVSKSEGRTRDLQDVTPSARARDLAVEVDKDARLVELILGEATGVVRCRKGVLVVDPEKLPR